MLIPISYNFEFCMTIKLKKKKIEILEVFGQNIDPNLVSFLKILVSHNCLGNAEEIENDSWLT